MFRFVSGGVASGFRVKIGDFDVDLCLGIVRGRGREVHLTASESRILATMMRNHGLPVSRSQLSEALGGKRSAFDRRVDIHICRLRRKLQDIHFPLFIRTVRRTGYALVR